MYLGKKPIFALFYSQSESTMNTQNDLFAPDNDTYLTLEQPCEGIYREKGSKFLAYVFPVRNEEQIKEHLETLRKKYYDATHHCYAYRLGRNGETWKANDDGEPNHTAGTPILNQLKSQTLTQVLAVVVRYYGGTKLGVSGLIHAYKTATAEALQEARIVEKIVKQPFILRFEYLQTNEVMRLVKDYQVDIIAQEFDNACKMEIAVRLKDVAAIKHGLSQIDVAFE
jgi:uncharacterized YigZ family protein